MEDSASDLSQLFSIDDSSLKIHFTPSAQRGIIASKNFKTGDKILGLIPKVQVLQTFRDDDHSKYRGNSCAYCHFEGPMPAFSSDITKISVSDETRNHMWKCHKCHIQLYCSKYCQLQDWPIHELECAVSCKRQDSGVHLISDTFERCVIRSLSRCSRYDRFKQQMKKMCNHKDIIETNNDYKLKTEQVVENITSVVRYWSLDLIKETCYVMFINSTILFDSFGGPIGMNFDPTLALFNHSCSPNAELFFENNQLKIYANADITCGEEIFLNYSMINLPRVLRQEELQHRFFFKCQCSKCSTTQDIHQDWSCKDCGNIIWNYSIVDYLNKTEGSSKFKNNCCRENFIVISNLQTSHFQNYTDLLDISEFNDTKESLFKIIESCYQLPEIGVEDFKKLSLDFSNLDIQFPIPQISMALEKFFEIHQEIVELDPLLPFFYNYTNNFVFTPQPISFPLKYYDFIITMLSLKTPIVFEVSFKMMIFCSSIVCFDKLSKIFGSEAKIYQRCATIIYNYHYLIKMDKDISYENFLEKRYNQSLTARDLNKGIQDFFNILQSHDKRFKKIDILRLLAEESIDAHKVLDEALQYIRSTFY